MTTFVTIQPKNRVDINQISRTVAIRNNSNIISGSASARDLISRDSSDGFTLPNNSSNPNPVDVINGLDRVRNFGNNLVGASLTNSGVTFLITPNVSESGGANYGEISDIRMPASIIYYLGSPSRIFTITAKLFARTQAEADYTYTTIRLLRSWRMPEKGAGQQGVGSGIEIATGDAGQSTPKILQLSGYNGMFNNITVVMTDLGLTFPEDVDYITASSGHKVPILSEASITLKEGRSIDDLKQFDINSFRSGRLPNW